MPCAPSPAMPCRMQQLRYISTSAASSSLTGSVGIKAELRALLADLSSRHGPVAALLPGLQEDKARIDELLQQLAASPDNSSSSSSSDAANDLGPQPLDGNVMGEWELVYASNGTVRHPTRVVFGFHQTPPVYGLLESSVTELGRAHLKAEERVGNPMEKCGLGLCLPSLCSKCMLGPPLAWAVSGCKSSVPIILTRGSPSDADPCPPPWVLPVQVVTRTPMVRALVSLSRSLPGAGISDIKQQLQLNNQGESGEMREG